MASVRRSGRKRTEHDYSTLAGIVAKRRKKATGHRVDQDDPEEKHAAEPEDGKGVDSEDDIVDDNGYDYDFVFTYDNQTYYQGDMPYKFPIPNEHTTLNIAYDSHSKEFPPMAMGDNGLRVPDDNEELNMTEFLVGILSIQHNKQLIRSEILYVVKRTAELAPDGDRVFAPVHVKWHSPTLYGHILIHAFKLDIFTSYVMDYLGENWATTNNSVHVMTTIVVAEMIHDCELIMSYVNRSERQRLTEVEDRMKECFKCIQMLIDVLVGPEVSETVITKFPNIDKHIIVLYTTPVFRYVVGTKNISDFFRGYSYLKLSVEKITTWDSLDEDTIGERVFTRFVAPMMDVHLKEDPRMKAIRMRKKSRRQELLNRDPKQVSEDIIWSLVTILVKKVFPLSYEGSWDETYLNIDGDEDRLIAILCLLQLCIGSRSRGIICINTFTMYDQADAHVLKSADDSVLSLLTMRPLITVKQLTKEKISSIQKASKLAIVGGDKFKNAMKKIDLDDDEKIISDVLAKTDDENAQRRITKPLQGYFLNPMMHPYLSVKPEDRLKQWHDPDDATTHDPRIIFCRLMAYARHVIRYRSMDTFPDIKWIQHDFGNGIKYYAVSKESEQTQRPSINSLTRFYNAKMTSMLKDVFSESGYLPENQLTNVGTHELRRLYVCYAFWKFAYGKMKEVSFARAVLNHESFEASLFYTSIQVKPIVETTSTESRLSDETLQRLEDALGEVDKLYDDVEDWKEDVLYELQSLQRLISDNIEGRAYVELVAVVDRYGNPHNIEKFPRKTRGTSAASRIQAGRRRVAELRDKNIDVNWEMMKRLGMNTRYIRAILT